MTPNKVQHFQEWLSGFKKKSVVVYVSKLPKEIEYKIAHEYRINGIDAQPPLDDENIIISVPSNYSFNLSDLKADKEAYDRIVNAPKYLLNLDTGEKIGPY